MAHRSAMFPPAFWHTFWIGSSVELLIAAVSVYVSPLFYPKDFPDSKKMLWHTTAAAVFPAFAVSFYAIPGTLKMWQEEPLSDILAASPNNQLYKALGYALAHFAVDGLLMAVMYKSFIAAMKKPLYIQMMAHHALSLLIWPRAFAVEACVFAVGYFMATEVTNIILNSRWFLVECKVEGMFMTIYSVLFFVSYTVVRILTIPVALVVVFRTNWAAYIAHISPVDVLLTLFCFIPFALNIFWYSLILKGLMKMLRRRDDALI
eukprot:2000754-Prymnesium_polylepis.1